MMRAHRLLCGLLVFVVLAAVLIAFVDRPLAEYLRGVDATHPAVINFFRAYTDLGKSKWYLWPAAFGIGLCALSVRQKLLPWHVRENSRRSGEVLFFLFSGIALSGVITDIIKFIIGRARPVILVRDDFYGFHPLSFDAAWNSMPSGHATTAFALAFVLISFLPRWRLVFLACACVLAGSRVMVNAHFLSDIFAGGIVAYLSVTILRYVLTCNGIFLFEKVFFPLTRDDAEDKNVL